MTKVFEEISYLHRTKSLVRILTFFEARSRQSPMIPVAGDSASILRNGSPLGWTILPFCRSSKALITSMLIKDDSTPWLVRRTDKVVLALSFDMADSL